jgi:hypothetical protein
MDIYIYIYRIYKLVQNNCGFFRKCNTSHVCFVYVPVTDADCSWGMVRLVVGMGVHDNVH